jgi:hypothetical protein
MFKFCRLPTWIAIALFAYVYYQRDQGGGILERVSACPLTRTAKFGAGIASVILIRLARWTN